MTDGSSRDVRFLLGHDGNAYKVRDMMIDGYWLTGYYVRILFEDYISKNDGDPVRLSHRLND